MLLVLNFEENNSKQFNSSSKKKLAIKSSCELKLYVLILKMNKDNKYIIHIITKAESMGQDEK